VNENNRLVDYSSGIEKASPKVENILERRRGKMNTVDEPSLARSLFFHSST
jgi:hypothetical protein